MLGLCPDELFADLTDPALWSGPHCSVQQPWLGTVPAEWEGKTKHLFHCYLCQLSSYWKCARPVAKSLSEGHWLTRSMVIVEEVDAQLLHVMVWHLAIWPTDGTAPRTSFLVQPCCFSERQRTECVVFAIKVNGRSTGSCSQGLWRSEKCLCGALGHNVGGGNGYVVATEKVKVGVASGAWEMYDRYVPHPDILGALWTSIHLANKQHSSLYACAHAIPAAEGHTPSRRRNHVLFGNLQWCSAGLEPGEPPEQCRAMLPVSQFRDTGL